MLINYVELHNFLSHTSTRVEFGRGLTSLVGPNGAGKSAIIDAVVFALFEDAYRAMRSGSKDGLKRRGAKEASVKLCFQVGGRTYLVERWIGGGGGPDALYQLRDGKKVPLASGARGVNREILKLLGLPRKEALLNTVVVRQGELERVIDAFTTASGKEDLLKVLGLKELEDIADALKEEISQLSRRLASFEALASRAEQLAAEVKHLEERRVDFQGKLSAAEKAVKMAEQAIERLRRQLESIPRDLDEQIQRLSSRLAASEGKVARLEEQLKTLKRRYQELQELLPKIEQAKTLASLAEIVEHLSREAASLQRLSIEMESKRRSIEELKSKLNDRLSSLAKSLNCPPIPSKILNSFMELKKLIEEVRGRKAFTEVSISKVEESIKSLKAAEAVCPTCRRPLSEEEKQRILHHLEAEAKSLGEEAEKLALQLSQLEAAVREAEYLGVHSIGEEQRSLEAEASKLTRIEEEYSRKLSAIKDDLQVLVTASRETPLEQLASKLASSIERGAPYFNLLSELVGSVKSAERLLKEFEGLERPEDLLEQMNQLRGELGVITSEVSWLREELKRLEEQQRLRTKLSQQLIKAERELGEVKREEARIKAEYQAVEEQLKEKKRELDEARKAQQEASQLSDFIRFLQYMRTNIFGKDGLLAKSYRASLKRGLEQYTSEYLQKLGMDYAIEFDEQLNLRIITSTGTASPEDLSAGEKVSLALALRLALAKSLSTGGGASDIIILDEPTVYLDEERRRELVRVLRDAADMVPQLIVVTHDREVIELSDMVYEISKENGISKVQPLTP